MSEREAAGGKENVRTVRLSSVSSAHAHCQPVTAATTAQRRNGPKVCVFRVGFHRKAKTRHWHPLPLRRKHKQNTRARVSDSRQLKVTEKSESYAGLFGGEVSGESGAVFVPMLRSGDGFVTHWSV